MVHIIESREEFELKVLWSDTGVVLVDFFAEWCGPCKVIAPVIEELSVENTDKATIYKVDVDELPELASQYDIFSIPTVLIFHNGVLSWEPFTGVFEQHDYQQALDTLV